MAHKKKTKQQRLIDALAYYDKYRPLRSRKRVIEEIRYQFNIGEKTMRFALLQRLTMQ